MKYTITDEKYSFVSMFNDQTGSYVRTGIIEEGRDTGVDPFMASFPHLIDIGIMGHCKHGRSGLCQKAGIGCYQSGAFVEKPNMSLRDFQRVIRECEGKVYQVALGGRGDPDQHEHFEGILSACKAAHIVPNFTTSGLGMTPELAGLCKAYCGAVAVSWYRGEYTYRAIDLLLQAGVKTNIHYVLGNDSLDEALARLWDNDFPAGIDAVVFLLQKPVGQGRQEDVLRADDPKVKSLFHQIDNGNHRFKVGLDSCCVPGVVNFCKHVIPEAIDPCEGARFSCYIDAQLTMLPCSFDQGMRYAVSLKNNTIQGVWNSPEFAAFRKPLRHECPQCDKRENCLGGCPLMPDIVLCNKKSGGLPA